MQIKEKPPTFECESVKATHIILQNNAKCNVDNVLNSFNPLKNEKSFVMFGECKCPQSPINGRKVSIHNRQNLTTLSGAMSGCKKHNALGIGIVLGETSRGNLCGIDIDNCINKRGIIHPEALELVKSFNSYTEVSLNGAGLHIIVYGTKKGKLCKNTNLNWCKALEVYDCNRYFTITGNTINGLPIAHRQEELDIFYEKYFRGEPQNDYPVDITRDLQGDLKDLKKGFQKDKKLIAYYKGYRPTSDESSCDIGFMYKLLYWSNNNVRLAIETFRNSPYASQKDEKHTQKMLRKDYLIRTAQKCLYKHTAGEGVRNG